MPFSGEAMHTISQRISDLMVKLETTEHQLEMVTEDLSQTCQVSFLQCLVSYITGPSHATHSPSVQNSHATQAFSIDYPGK